MEVSTRVARLAWVLLTKVSAGDKGTDMWGLARPARPPTPHFYWPALASPAPNPSLLSTGPRPARPPTPHFYWPTPHFYWPDPSLLLARPLTSICQARPRHAEPCRTVSGHVGTSAGMCRASLVRVAVSA